MWLSISWDQQFRHHTQNLVPTFNLLFIFLLSRKPWHSVMVSKSFLKINYFDSHLVFHTSSLVPILWAILNKSWRQHSTKKQLYGHLPPITKTIQVRRTRHVGHFLRRRDELISDVLLWTPSHGQAKAGCPARTYIQQLCANTGWRPTRSDGQ